MKDSILFVGSDYIDTDDVANNWGQTTKYFSVEKLKQLNKKQTFIICSKCDWGNKHENQDKITKSNGTPWGNTLVNWNMREWKEKTGNKFKATGTIGSIHNSTLQ